jgi:predicted tellurium resistance membrane protein TerC
VRLPYHTILAGLAFFAVAATCQALGDTAASVPASRPVVGTTFAELFTFQNFLTMLTLSGLEIVLGIDNLVVIAIVSGRVRKDLASLCRKVGLFGALFMRLGLLTTINFIMSLRNPLFSVANFAISGRDLVLIIGGLFLLWKAVKEIHELVDVDSADEQTGQTGKISFGWAIVQIMFFDIIFSLDSVITAVGIGSHLYVMYAAVIVAVGVMLLFADPIAAYIEKYPTVKMLALAFLILIGIILILDGLHLHIDKSYIYLAMGFSLLVELLNQWAARTKIRNQQILASVPRETLGDHLPEGGPHGYGGDEKR